MLKIYKLLLGVFALFYLSGCDLLAPLEFDYSALLASNPRSILVLMPESDSNDVNAGPTVLATTLVPLAERGYYVFPAALVNDTFRYNGITEPAEIRQVSHKRLREIFGADAFLDLHVDEFGSSYQIIDSVYVVKVTASLYDLRNGQLLWKGEVSTDNHTSSASGKDGIIASMVGALIKQAADNLLDTGVDLAKQNANEMYSNSMTAPLLYGPLSRNYRQDSVLQHGE